MRRFFQNKWFPAKAFTSFESNEASMKLFSNSSSQHILHETNLANESLLAQKSFQQKVVANSRNINENATEREDWFCNNHSKESLKKSFTQSRGYFSNKTKKSSANELKLFEAKQQKQTFLSLTSFLENSRKQCTMTHLNCFC